MDEWSQIKVLNVAQSSECGVRTRHPKPPCTSAALTGFPLYWCIRTPAGNHYINREQNRWTRTDRATGSVPIHDHFSGWADLYNYFIILVHTVHTCHSSSDKKDLSVCQEVDRLKSPSLNGG